MVYDNVLAGLFVLDQQIDITDDLEALDLRLHLKLYADDFIVRRESLKMTGERETVLIVGFLKVYIAVKRPLERDLGIVIGEIQFQKLLRLHDSFEHQLEPFMHLAAVLCEYVFVLFNPRLSEPLKIEAVGAFVRLRRRRPAPDSILQLFGVFAHLKQYVVGLNRVAGVALVNTRLLVAAVVLGLAAAEIYLVGME